MPWGLPMVTTLHPLCTLAFVLLTNATYASSFNQILAVESAHGMKICLKPPITFSPNIGLKQKLHNHEALTKLK